MKRWTLCLLCLLSAGSLTYLAAQTLSAKVWVADDQIRALEWSSLVSQIKISEELGLGREVVAQTDHATLLAVAIRTGEKPHAHMKSDMFVMVQQGFGEMFVDGKRIEMKAGDSVFVPKGKPHYFINKDTKPSIALVLFSPPLQPGDNVPVESK